MASNRIFCGLILAFSLIVVSINALSESRVIPSHVKISSSALDFTAIDIDGNNITLSDFRSNVVVLDFMTKWCGPCWTKIDEVLIPFWSEYKDKAVVVISICWDANAEELRGLREEHPGMDWYVISDPYASSIRDPFNIEVTPTVIVVDKSGCMRPECLPEYTPNLTLEQLKKCVDELLLE